MTSVHVEVTDVIFCCYHISITPLISLRHKQVWAPSAILLYPNKEVVTKVSLRKLRLAESAAGIVSEDDETIMGRVRIYELAPIYEPLPTSEDLDYYC